MDTKSFDAALFKKGEYTASSFFLQEVVFKYE